VRSRGLVIHRDSGESGHASKARCSDSMITLRAADAVAQSTTEHAIRTPVDSFGPRGIASACKTGLAAQAFDAYAGCTTWRGWRRSIPRGSPCLASRWVGPRC
jgi:hypothetical protein